MPRQPARPKWPRGAKYAPAHEVYACVVADQHGGDWRIYAKWIKAQPDMLIATRRLSQDRVLAWDVLMGVI